MPLRITDEMRSMIASAMVGGGDCGPGDDHVWCLCCAPDAVPVCALIVGDKYAAALQSWFYGGLGCGFHHADIRRRELGMESVGPAREQDFLDCISELDEIWTDAERGY